MLKRLFITLALLLCPLSAFAQGQFTAGSGVARRIVRGGTTPATCSVGDVFYNTMSNTAFLCNAVNTYTAFAVGAAGANTALSNLASVAINTTLVSDTNNTDDLGTSGINWRTGYFGTSIFNPAYISKAADPADAGVLRLGFGETVCSENSPTGTDSCFDYTTIGAGGITNGWLFDNVAASLIYADTRLTSAGFFATSANDVADAGAVRSSNGATGDFCWEASPAGTDVCFDIDSAEQVNFTGASKFIIVAPVQATSFVTTSLGGVGGTLDLLQGTAATAAASHDICYGDSTANAILCSFNNGTFYQMPQRIALGTSALGTGAISSATCATVVTTAATGAATTDNLAADFNADPSATTGYAPSATGGLYIIKYITANNVNFKVCNSTGGSITPGAATLQWRVTR